MDYNEMKNDRELVIKYYKYGYCIFKGTVMYKAYPFMYGFGSIFSAQFTGILKNLIT